MFNLELAKTKIKGQFDQLNFIIEDICEVTDYINNNIDTLDQLKIVKEKFEKVFNLRNRYKEIIFIAENQIKELLIVKDFTIPYNNELTRITHQLEYAISTLDMALIDKFKRKNITKFITERPSGHFQVEFIFKNIPIEIFDESRSESGYKPLIRELTIDEDEEYIGTVFEICPPNKIDQTTFQIDDFINSALYNMLKDQDGRNEIYGDYYTDLIDKENKRLKKKPCTLENFEPREWQVKAYEKWNNKPNNYHGTFSVATGAGKTLFSLFCLEQEIKKGRDILTIIVVPSKAIMHNWFQTLIKDFHVRKEDIGRRGSGHGNVLWNSKKFIIYISKTAQNELAQHTTDFEELLIKRNLKIYQFYIFDECHHYATANHLKMLDGLSMIKEDNDGIDYYSMGLSATPERSDMKEKYFYHAIGPVIYRYNILEALADDIVAPFIIKNVKCKLNKKERKTSNIFKRKVLGLSNTLDELLIYPNKVTRDIEPVSESPIYWAYRIIGNNQEILKKLSQRKNRFINNFGEEIGNIKMEEWLDRKENINFKITHTASMLVAAVTKSRRYIMTTKHRKKKCLRLVSKHINNKVIVFCEYIESADEIYDKLVERFGEDRIKRYYSLSKEQKQDDDGGKKTRERENREALESFKNGHANVIVTVKSFDEGVDVPASDVGILFQSSVSKRQAIQRLGRIVRRKDNQTNIPILYHLYSAKDELPFLHTYFEKPEDLVSNKADIDYWNDISNYGEYNNSSLGNMLEEEISKIRKYKVGVNKIVFWPSIYNLSKYDL